MPIDAIHSSAQTWKNPGEESPRSKTDEVVENLFRTSEDSFALTPRREIRVGTPSRKHYPNEIPKMTGKQFHTMCGHLKNRPIHTFDTSPTASPKNAKAKFSATVEVGSDGYITSPRGTQYSAHRKLNPDGKNVIFPVRGPKIERVSGNEAIRIAKELRESQKK